MKIFIVLLLLTYQVSLTAQLTQQLRTPNKTSVLAFGTTMSKIESDIYLKSEDKIIDTVYQPLTTDKSAENPVANKINLITPNLKSTDTASKCGNLLLSNTTCDPIRKALSKMGYKLSFVSHTSFHQSIPFTSVGNIVLSEVNFY